MNREIAIKVFYTRDSVVRRFSIPENTSFDEFLRQIHMMNVGKHHEGSEVVLKYQDEEGDWVTCSTSDEWEEAKSCSVTVLRINVIHSGSTLHNLQRSGEIMSREVMDKFKNQANSIILRLQTEMDSERVQKGKDVLNEVKDGLNNAFRELVDGLIQSAKGRKLSDLIRDDVAEEEIGEEIHCPEPPQHPQPLPTIPDPEPEPLKVDDERQNFDEGELDFSDDTSTDSSIEHVEAELIPEPDPVIELTPEQDINTIVMDEEVPAKAPVVVPADFKYLEEVYQLIDMGFEDVEINQKLLLKHKGNVSKVVAVLLK